jgi:hypothetical protein
MRDSRNAMPPRRHDLGLRSRQGACADTGVDRFGAERPGELAESAGDESSPVGRSVGELVLVRRHAGARSAGGDPHSVELRDFLLDSHAGEQILDAVSDGQPHITPRQHGSLARPVLCHHVASVRHTRASVRRAVGSDNFRKCLTERKLRR